MSSVQMSLLHIGSRRWRKSLDNTDAAHNGSVKLAGAGASRAPRRLSNMIRRAARFRSCSSDPTPLSAIS